MRSFLLAIATVILLIPISMSATSAPSNACQMKANPISVVSVRTTASQQDASFAFLNTLTQKEIQLEPNRFEAAYIMVRCPYSGQYYIAGNVPPPYCYGPNY